LGEAILAPAPGIVVAAWKANWGWGNEGALLIRHTRDDLQLAGGPEYYYSEFDHLKYDDIRSIAEGQHVRRGEKLATVSTPGGNSRYLPEVHWEVWEIDDDSATTWRTNRFKGRYWTNSTGRLIDPLYMMARDTPPDEDGSVEIPVYEAGRDYREFRGFTYILPCTKTPSREPAQQAAAVRPDAASPRAPSRE
jgi:murein DD-endopeptidase MepM/ murein hydrolase activator NlpD